MSLSAYDVDAAGYTSVLTATAGNTPTLELGTALDANSNNFTEVGALTMSGTLSIGTNGVGTSFNFEKAAASQFVIDAASVPTTVNSLLVDNRSATANVGAITTSFGNTADVSGVHGFSCTQVAGPTALTSTNLTACYIGAPRGSGTDAATAFRFDLFSEGPAVNGTGLEIAHAIGGTGFGDPADYDHSLYIASGALTFFDHAGVVQTTNEAGAASAWTFTHADGLSDGAGATWTENLSAGQGAGANGGKTINIGNAGSGGAGVYLIQADTGEDVRSASCASTGVCTIADGNATAVYSLTTSGGLNIGTGGALSGVASIAAAANQSTLALNIPVTGTDATTHTISLRIDTDSVGISVAATGDGAGAVGNVTTQIGVNAVGADIVTIGDANADVSITDGQWAIAASGSVTGFTSVGMGGALTGVTTLGASGNATWSGTAHLIHTGTAPAVTVCGTDPAIVGTDLAGKVTIGTGGVTACTVTFAAAYSSAPACSIGASITLVTTTTTASVLTLTHAVDMSAAVISYTCIEGS